MPGTLIVKPEYARLIHDTDFIVRMDPYCVIKIGSQSQSTGVCENGGQNPSWGSVPLSFHINYEDVVNVEVWDSDFISRNDLIGQGFLSISSITSKGVNPSLVCSLSYKGRPAGDAYIQFEWYGEPAYGYQPGGYQQGYQQPGTGYQQQGKGYQQQQPNYGYQQQQPNAPEYQQQAPGYQQGAPGYQQPAMPYGKPWGF